MRRQTSLTRAAPVSGLVLAFFFAGMMSSESHLSAEKAVSGEALADWKNKRRCIQGHLLVSN
jgi:hypothetical protein